MASYILIAVLLVATYIYSVTSEVRESSFRSKCIHHDATVRKVQARSKLDCAAKCSNIKCDGFTFDKVTKECSMAIDGGLTDCGSHPLNIHSYVCIICLK